MNLPSPGSDSSQKRWEQIQNVLSQIADLDEAEQSRQLVILADGDEELRAEVQSLLEFDSDRQLICSTEATLAENKTGTRVGRYRLLFPLSVNVKSEVWKAVEDSLDRPDSSLGRHAAIKFLRNVGGSTNQRRFEQEVEFLEHFDHPGIVQLLDSGSTEQGTSYLVTQFVGGVDIIECADSRRLTLDDRIRLFQQVCEAVEYAHRFLVIHRDIKPANIIVNESNQPVLIDFGISKQLELSSADMRNLTQTHERPMTPAYASPEQMRGEPISAVTDVYGLGLVLYQLLCGHHAYSDRAHLPETQFFDRIVSAPPKPPSQMIAGLSNALIKVPAESSLGIERSRPEPAEVLKRRMQSGLDAIVLKAIEKTPGDRYQTVAELRNALNEFSSSANKAGGRRSWNSPAVLAAAIGLLSIFALSAAFSVFYWLNASATTDADGMQTLEQLGFAEQVVVKQVDFDRLDSETWQQAPMGIQLAVANLAIENARYDIAQKIARHQKQQLEAMDWEQRLGLADLFSKLGLFTNALDCLPDDPSEFSVIAAERTELEKFRSLVCIVFAKCGRLTPARQLNDARDQPQFPAELEQRIIEGLVRDADRWHHGAKEMMQEISKDTFRDAVESGELSELVQHAYRMLWAKLIASRDELEQLSTTERDQPGSLRKSEIDLHLTQRRLNEGELKLGKELAAEVLQRFTRDGMPAHDLAISTVARIESKSLQLNNLKEYFTVLESQGEIGTLQALFLGARVMGGSQDESADYQKYQSISKYVWPIEDDYMRLIFLRESWQPALLENPAEAKRIADAMLKTSAAIHRDGQVDQAYDLAAAAIVASRTGDPTVVTDCRRECALWLQAEIERVPDNAGTAFLSAIDTTSDTNFVFDNVADPKCKNSADWVFEYLMHRANDAKDQLEMAAYFCEQQLLCNPAATGRVAKAVLSKLNDAGSSPNPDAVVRIKKAARIVFANED